MPKNGFVNAMGFRHIHELQVIYRRFSKHQTFLRVLTARGLHCKTQLLELPSLTCPIESSRFRRELGS